MPLAHSAEPALSSTSMEPRRPWPWQLSPPAQLLTPVAWISPALVLAFQSNRHGLTPSKPKTVTRRMASPTPTWPAIAWMSSKPSWDIWPSNARISSQPSPSQMRLKLRPQRPPASIRLRWTYHPIKSSSKYTPSAGCTLTTWVAFWSRRAWATNM